MPGSKGFRLTGQLGDVMRESAEAALSYVRSKATLYGIEDAFFDENDIHLHVPGGAIPKDGPSAGVAMIISLLSLAKEVRVRPNVAMTGEITLRGRVLPVGGIKEKVLAAYRARIKTILLPKRNEKDLEDIPAVIRKRLKFHFCETVQEAIAVALPVRPKRATRGKPGSASRRAARGRASDKRSSSGRAAARKAPVRNAKRQPGQK